MATLDEIEAATDALTLKQKEDLLRFLAARLEPVRTPHGTPQPGKPRLVRQEDGDVLLEAAPDAPPMTPETVKRMLADWP